MCFRLIKTLSWQKEKKTATLMFWLIELDKHVESTRFLSYCHYCNNLDELGWISSFFEKLVGLALIMIIFWQCVCMQSRTLTSRLTDCGTTPLADLNIWFCSACQFFAYLATSSCIFLKILRKGYIKVLTVRLLSWDHNMFFSFSTIPVWICLISC
jgi:hypothetical protein